MRPKIAIISALSNWCSYLSKTLSFLFGEKIEFVEYSSDKNIIREPVVADLILISEPIIYYSAYRFFDPSTPTIVVTSTITQSQYETLQSLPVGTRVLIVNDTNSAVIDTISKFMDLGLNHLEYYPYSPNSAEITNEVRPLIAVTPGEPGLVPDYIETVVDIGPRVIDGHVVTEIAIRTGLEYLLKSEPIVNYLANVCTSKNSTSYLLERAIAVSEGFFSLANAHAEGIVIVDKSGLVQNCNEKAANIIGSREKTIGRQISQLLPCPMTTDIQSVLYDTGTQLAKIGSAAISLRIIPINANNSFCGALIEINTFAEEEKHSTLRHQIIKRGHIAKKTFDDMVTADPDMLNLKRDAEKYAKSPATILITGESGTGKEILAQAIHNASFRKDGPFVAINCSALPASLLESELFGYEEGAFTGAKKGGKTGLFELASAGTIFLDEIGDMDLHLQSRILRVLEEREVLKIGGDTIRPIDIRVIAATKQNLLSMIDQGTFREDLYYRLNVIPLELPPLRERPVDILPLFHHFAKAMGRAFTLSPRAEELLIANPWRGNARELKNKVEYLAALNLSRINAEDLDVPGRGGRGRALPMESGLPGLREPEDQAPSAQSGGAVLSQSQENAVRQFNAEIAGEEFHYYLILRSLVNGRGQGVSRRRIFLDIQRENYQISEAEIRKIIQTLCRHRLAIQGKGRSGARVTPLGVAVFEKTRENPALKKMLYHLDI